MMRRVLVACVAFLVAALGMASVSEACFLRRCGGRFFQRRSCRNQCYTSYQTSSKGGKDAYGNGGSGDGSTWVPKDPTEEQLGAPAATPKKLPQVPEFLIADRA